MSATRVVFGARPVEEVLRARPKEVQALFVARGRRREAWLEDAVSRHSLQPQTRDNAELERLAEGGNHQGLVVVVGAYPYCALQDLIARAEGTTQRPLLVLDQVQDPRNLGAILRSAYALGAAGVVLPERRSAPVSPVVVKTSAGATEHLAIARVTNLARALEALRSAGYWLVGAAGEEEGQAPEALDLIDHVALVLGSEEKGLRRNTRSKCDLLVTIPMDGALDSLNVAVAAGILLAEAARQRRAST